MMEQSFSSTIAVKGKTLYIELPFDPNVAWGQKRRHYVHGLVNGIRIRTLIKENGSGYILTFGAAWLRDSGVEASQPVEVFLEPEGPQLSTIAGDIAAALRAEPSATEFFESLATHYRKNYIGWIEGAKRPETRAKRITETVKLLKDGKQSK